MLNSVDGGILSGGYCMLIACTHCLAENFLLAPLIFRLKLFELGVPGKATHDSNFRRFNRNLSLVWSALPYLAMKFECSDGLLVRSATSFH